MKIFITGISRGLGKALMETCAARGYEVWGVSRTIGSRDEGRIHYRKCDIAVFSEVQTVYEEMIGSGYIPDAVVLSASVLSNDYQGKLDLKVFMETIQVNLLGNVYWLQLLLPHFLSRPEGGVFLNVSSLASFRAIVRRKIAYPASKCAMDMVFEGMRIQTGEPQVRFLTARIGPLGEVRKLPLITTTYGDAAEKIVAKIESGASGTFVYPTCAGMLFKMATLLPDSLIRRIVHERS